MEQKPFVFLLNFDGTEWAGARPDDSGQKGPLDDLIKSAEGAEVLDLSGVPEKLRNKCAMMGPRPDASLPAGTRIPGIAENVLSNLDRVSLDVWIHAWEVAFPDKIRQGTVKNGAIVWRSQSPAAYRPTQAPASA